MAIKTVQTVPWKTNNWKCFCDFCGKATSKFEKEPGDAAEVAYKEGFTTITLDVAIPLKWMCRECNLARAAKKPNGKASSPILGN